MFRKVKVFVKGHYSLMVVHFHITMYRRSLSYNGLDLRCIKVTSAPHENIADNNIDWIIMIKNYMKIIVVNSYRVHTASLAQLTFVICIVSDAHGCDMIYFVVLSYFMVG